MRWIAKSKTTHIIALFGVFAVLTSFSLTGTDFSHTAISFPAEEDTLTELAYHFPEQAGEQAVLNKSDDTDFSFVRDVSHRFFDLFGTPVSRNASCFSRLQSHSTENSCGNISKIQIKLRI
jgi:hypothetical protein